MGIHMASYAFVSGTYTVTSLGPFKKYVPPKGGGG